jgi:hypothetical protein
MVPVKLPSPVRKELGRSRDQPQIHSLERLSRRNLDGWVLRSPQAVLAHESETRRHMGVMNGRRPVLLAAGTTALTADCPSLLVAVEALHVFARSLGAETDMDYLAEEDDCQA